MKIAIDSSGKGFSKSWVTYCENTGLPYKLVNFRSSDIIEQLKECDLVMWHFHQGSPIDNLFAKQLLYSLQLSGKKVFPDFNTVWHFNDKLGQKYLFEALGVPMPETFVFYKKKEAIEWARTAVFPKVFKLRGGASSQNVYLIKGYAQAVRYIRRSFGRGFANYNAFRSISERWRKFRMGTSNLRDVIEGVIRIFYPPEYSRIMGRERGYIMFQEYIPNRDHDIRIIVIGNRALAIKRMVRENDFRASGSGILQYDKKLFSKELISLAFDIASRIKAQSVAMDFLYNHEQPLLVEISYGFPTSNFTDGCEGYFDRDLNWIDLKLEPYKWMIESLIGNDPHVMHGNLYQ